MYYHNITTTTTTTVTMTEKKEKKEKQKRQVATGERSKVENKATNDTVSENNNKVTWSSSAPPLINIRVQHGGRGYSSSSSYSYASASAAASSSSSRLTTESERSDYYANYDPMTGIKIASTLSAFFTMAVLYVVYKVGLQ